MKTDLLDIRHADCMDLMREFPDKHFELAIVDPPYGIGFGTFNRTNKASNGQRIKADKYKNGEWDSSAPPDEYFDELMRVSKSQIIWGGNYFPRIWINGCRGFIFWHKHQPCENFADGELAWTSFDQNARIFDFPYYGNIEGKTSAPDKIHPTQKPVALYRWLLANYANAGDKILDTHLGSGSSAIACHYAGHHLTACELDADYYKAACERIDRETRQQTLFTETPTQTTTQTELI